MRVRCVRCGVTFPTGKEFADHIRDWGECKAPTPCFFGGYQPATPEPPEWSSNTITIPAGAMGPNDVLRIEGAATWKNGKVGKVDVQIVSVERITPDPIAEFNERRKAKRENRSPSITDILHEALNKRSSDTLARAMSTPLPHDPDMHTRLMPWRGK